MARVHLLLAANCLVGAVVIAACIGDDPAIGTNPSTPDGGTSSSSSGSSGSPVEGGTSSSSGDSGQPLCGTLNTACCTGNTCNGGAQCNGTICVCPANLTACGTSCVDTKSTTQHCGRCDHDCGGGMCSNSQCSTYTVTPSQPLVAALFVDGGRLYWTRGFNNQSFGGFYSAKLDGTDLVTVFDAGAKGCSSATTAQGKAYVLCANASNQKDIRVCTLPCGAGSSTVFKGALASANAIAADPASGTVFYTVPTLYNQAPNGSVFDTAGNRVGAMNQANPVALTVANGSIFWLNGGTYAADTAQKNGGVKRASLADRATEISVVTAGAKYLDNSTLSVDANNVYYTGRELIDNDTDVVNANAGATGALPNLFANAVGAYVASDGTNVFFNETSSNSVRYCSRTAGCSGGKTLLSPNESDVLALTVDATSVIWAKQNGEIRRIAKP